MGKIHEELKKVFEGKIFFRVILITGIVIVFLLVFSAGVTVGFHKASYGRAWGEHYNENFGMGHRMPPMGIIGNPGMMDYFPNAHGATGKIIKMEAQNIILQDKDSTEKSILLNSDTKIQKGRMDIAISDLKIDDFIVVIGTPDDKGMIEAKFIRVIPSPEFLN
ncbi:MAG TPA: hypothetical protein VGO21_04360 [Candidatus Paceibacterota bacterium]|jgi:hypothetical protein|nr:hypothetical protein [Candidatus Paceibacterota bacterium]